MKSRNENKLQSSQHQLVKNTMFLYLMTFSSYALNLLTIPYLTRVLGPIVYGRIGIAVGYMTYIQIILDFGFILSATQLISENRTNAEYATTVIASVTTVKMILSCFIFVALYILFVQGFIEYEVAKLLIFYFFSCLCTALLPDYFYRGIENMKVISIRTVSVRIFFTILIFVFVKSERDVIFVPVSMFVGNLVALIITYLDLSKRYEIKFKRPSFNHMLNMVKMTIPFFISRFASTFYQALDVIILGKVYTSSPLVGYYSSADKIIALSKTGASPIADSLYPYMLKNKNYRLVKKVLLIFMPIITIGVVIIGIYANPICVLLFGKEYSQAGNVLRLLLPIAWVILPTYIIAFPVMSPLGLAKYANMSNVLGMCFQIIGLFVLYFCGAFNIYTICGLTSLTEISVFVFRLSVVLAYLKKMKNAKVY